MVIYSISIREMEFYYFITFWNRSRNGTCEVEVEVEVVVRILIVRAQKAGSGSKGIGAEAGGAGVEEPGVEEPGVGAGGRVGVGGWAGKRAPGQGSTHRALSSSGIVLRLVLIVL